MNVHRWRHLEGSDPAAHELLLQVQALQRRLIAVTEASAFCHWIWMWLTALPEAP